ncbi:hypothetical protein [Streptomyces coffeae]|uniref:DUF3558 domain-containing protein n=1 Tax=Streptomyces coffeae TaxID=621382 RepID=A0ABS1NLD7_9ACTN|nr:hypothetical protein [Streptomyces coffeae]MBL1100922.1 hypothetical protein [Streptomyces coffeae]
MNRTSASLVIVALAVTAVGCGDDGRGYAVPEKICDTKVDPDLLAPLLSDGEKIHQRDVPREHGATCDVSVQGGDGGGVYITRDAVTEGVDPLEVKKDTLIGYGNAKKVDIGDDARLGDKGALVTTSCAPKGKDTTFALEVSLSSPTPKDVSERRKALERFLRSYLPTAAKAQGCRS